MSATQPPPYAGPPGDAGLFPPPPPLDQDEAAIRTEVRAPFGAPPPQPTGLIDELVVPYAYERVYAAVTRHKGRILMRLISLCLTVLILIGLQLWRHAKHLQTSLFGWPYWALLGVSLAVSLALLGRELWLWRRAKAQAAMLRPGPAMVIARPGVEFAGRRVGWEQVAGMQARTLRFGRGDRFIVHLAGAKNMSMPFGMLDAAPSALDSAARAFSGERVGVDFSKMDN